MRRILSLSTIIVLALLITASSAQAYRFTIQANGYLSQPQVHKIERALSFQVNRQVARYWHLNPASFGPGGSPIVVTTAAATNMACDEAYGCHEAGPGTLWIDGQQRLGDLENTISHEVVEAEVDPTADFHIGRRLVEVCDPAGWNYPGLSGVTLSDFVLPAYFHGHETDDFKHWLM